ncbi:sugar diacid recognition [Bifidobacterium primatium]|uniref:Sugar diacid recognition n=1 Tax=Bifidobacterium primatium TaxID=2045438 RepID=A0A2M9HBG2_9BIFI|nr:sugar diacid recognition domain-containing protein [Bifidobacterium primatium]PJM74148.1 sugar diacid recognition [Bifidobacterium primatium]
MNIDSRIAQTIVENLKNIIRHDINFFSPDGVMIASTDPARIGSRHDAARLAAAERCTIAVDTDSQFEGARHGINAPVMLGDDVVAVIGITGERAEVEPFGEVIRKMTEILIRENMDQVTRFDRRMMATNLIGLLGAQDHDRGLVEYLATTLGLDMKTPHRMAIGRCTQQDADHSGRDDIYDILSRHLANRADTVFAVSAQGFQLLLGERADDEDSNSGNGSNDDKQPLLDTLEAIRKDIEHALDRPISIGVGERALTADRCWRSYGQARTTVDWLRFTDQARVADYDSIGLGIVASAVDRDTAQRFVAQVFAGLSEQDIDHFHTTFEVYTRHNGSINRAANELFLHKNTLQNHLNAMARRTGYNPRDLADHDTLAMAFLLRSHLAFRAQ